MLGEAGPLSRLLPGHRVRPSQLAMAERIEHVLDHGGTLLVEAGTGTGKTLAYLVPLLLAGERAVVSTGTLALEDQIMNHDVPLLERTFGRPLNVVCLKGLTNYLCLRRFEEYRSEVGRADGARGGARLALLEDWRQTTTTGDRAELHEMEESAELWARVRSSHETRVGSKCAFYEECFVTQARARAQSADIVIVNHHLYFADLAARGPHGGGFLPDHRVVVFDEAHQIEDTLTQFFGVSVSPARIELLVRDVSRAAADLKGEGAEEDGRSLAALGEQALRAAHEFFDAVPARGPEDGARVPLPRDVFHGPLEAKMFALDAALDELALSVKQRLRGDVGDVADALVRRAAAVRDDLARIAEGATGKQATWSEARGRRVTVGASPIDVSEIFRSEVLDRQAAVVLTSATLSTSGTFNFLRSRLGIREGAEELLLESPFQVAEQAALYVPAGAPDPRDPRFGEFLRSEVLALVRAAGGGAMVLCTSLRSMEALGRAAKAELVGTTVLVQGDMPKAALLERFKDDGKAVLIGAQSFWQGVDVPGDALRLVIIDKLPFDVPTDPLVVARSRRLEEQGEQPFARLLVPSAALELKQGFGRLLRRETDRGVVAILDGRLLTKGYGKVILRSLPPARRIGTLDEVRAFYQAGEAGHG